MSIEHVMTRTPACCTPNTGLAEIARMMVKHDCGLIPLVRSVADLRLVGVITDRDIVSRLVAEGRNPLNLRAETCMSQPVVTVNIGDSVGECIRVMELHRIRRVPVVDGDGVMRGIVSQADIAHHAARGSTGQLVKTVSENGRVRPPQAKGTVKRAAVAAPRPARGPVDAPGKRHRKPMPAMPMDKRMGEPSGRKMGQKSVKGGRRGA